MKLFLIVLALLLSGCAHTPPIGLATPAQMPPLPPSLAQSAKPLPPLVGKTLGERELEDAQSDKQYNATATQLNAVLAAWDCVRKALNERSDATKCF